MEHAQRRGTSKGHQGMVAGTKEPQTCSSQVDPIEEEINRQTTTGASVPSKCI